MSILVDRLLEKDESKKTWFILCYPKPTESEVSSRIEELRTLGVDSLNFRGKTNLFGIPILGKGHVGVVVAALHKGSEVALKIRRVDADRETMQREAELLKRANKVSVGPRFLGCTENFLLMELVEGNNIQEWLREEKKVEEVRRVLRDLMEQCKRLDEEGIDHGELSKAHKHVVITASNQIRIIDFETASTTRRALNVTSIAHYIFFHKKNSQAAQKTLGEIDLEQLRTKLRTYKKEPTEKNLKTILTTTRLQT